MSDAQRNNSSGKESFDSVDKINLNKGIKQEEEKIMNRINKNRPATPSSRPGNWG